MKGKRAEYLHDLVSRDFNAVKAVVRLHWPAYRTDEIARMFRLPEHRVANALANVKDDEARKRGLA
jgi:hypothetical protein